MSPEKIREIPHVSPLEHYLRTMKVRRRTGDLTKEEQKMLRDFFEEAENVVAGFSDDESDEKALEEQGHCPAGGSSSAHPIYMGIGGSTGKERGTLTSPEIIIKFYFSAIPKVMSK